MAQRRPTRLRKEARARGTSARAPRGSPASSTAAGAPVPACRATAGGAIDVTKGRASSLTRFPFQMGSACSRRSSANTPRSMSTGTGPTSMGAAAVRRTTTGSGRRSSSATVSFRWSFRGFAGFKPIAAERGSSRAAAGCTGSTTHGSIARRHPTSGRSRSGPRTFSSRARRATSSCMQGTTETGKRQRPSTSSMQPPLPS